METEIYGAVSRKLDKLEEELKVSKIKYDELNKNYKELASSNLELRWQLNEGDKV